MKKIVSILILLTSFQYTGAQTPLNQAPDFTVKTLESEMIYLYPLLEEGKIVVVNFYSTTCGPCQLYAPYFQEAYELFGHNSGNVVFINMNINDNNQGVENFNLIQGISLPSVSGTQGGGESVYNDYEVMAYPTVIVITPDKLIFNPHVFVPNIENIIEAVQEAGGTLVGHEEINDQTANWRFFQENSKQGSITYDASNHSVASISIYALSGQCMQHIENLTVNPGANSFSIDLSLFRSGIYIVEFKDEKTAAKHKKIYLH
jgi:thiol-disulfide isomerase/thioredoxin